MTARAMNPRSITSDPLAPLADRLGLAPGALYTLIVGAVLAVALTLTGPPAAFSTQTIIAPDGGLGDLAAPPVAVVDDTPVTTTTTSAPAPAPAFLPPAAPSPTVQNTPVPTTAVVASGPDEGDILADVDVPGRVTAVEAVVGGVVVAVDRDDADPRIVRLDDTGEVVGSIVIEGRDLSADIDIIDLTVDRSGSLIALVGGPTEVIRIDAAGAVESLGTLGDLPPCALPLGLPVACEPGVDDHPVGADSIAISGDRVFVTDPGQATLWIVEDGVAAAASSDVAYRPTEETTGLTGIVATSDDVAIATVGASLVEFTVTDSEVTATALADLPSNATALARSRDGTLAVLALDGAVHRLDRSYRSSPVTAGLRKGAVDIATTADALWVVRPGDKTSTVLRMHLEGNPS